MLRALTLIIYKNKIQSMQKSKRVLGNSIIAGMKAKGMSLNKNKRIFNSHKIEELAAIAKAIKR